MKYKVAIIVCLWSICFTSIVYAQNNDPSLDLTPSPNAISLGKFGEIPVSLYSGLPSISIPIYQLKGKELSLDITLDYHADGIMPNIHPGWVGSGWNLNAGGAITRILNRQPDEMNLSNGAWKGFYYSYSSLNDNSWSSTSALQTEASFPLDLDTEPDEFLFNFLGYSGKFFLDHNGNWRVQSDKPIRVEFNNTFARPYIEKYEYGQGSNKIVHPFSGFTLVDEYGTRYTFGKNDNSIGEDDAIEYSDYINQTDINRQAENFFASTWYLTKIEPSNKKESIYLNYARGPYISSLTRNYSNSSIIGGYTHDTWWLSTDCHSITSNNNISGKFISPVYLQSIEYPEQNTKLVFDISISNDLKYNQNNYFYIFNDPNREIPIMGYNNIIKMPWYDNLITITELNNANWKGFIWMKLDNIKLLNTSGGGALKTYQFIYDENSRLSLTKLISKDRNLNEISKYSFEYIPGTLPNYLTTITDHWGYNNNILFPTDLSSADFNALRAPDEEKMKIGALKKITYPTGGSTEFEYQANRFRYISDNNVVDSFDVIGFAGGLRVSKIRSISENGSNIVKEYFYVKNYSSTANLDDLKSSGILCSRPKYSFTINGTDRGGSSFTETLTTCNSIIPLTNSSRENYIGYSEVVEKIGDGSYNIYKYTNQLNGYHDNLPVNSYQKDLLSHIPISSRSFERGKLLVKRSFSSSDKKVYEEAYHYMRTTDNDIPRTVQQDYIVVCTNSSASRYTFSRIANYLYTHSLLPDELKATQWDVNGLNPVTKTSSYKYNTLKMVTNEENVQSDGSILENVTSYSGDYYPPVFNWYTSNYNTCIDRTERDKAGCISSCNNDHDCINACIHTYSADLLACQTAFNTAKLNIENNNGKIFKDMFEKNMIAYPVEKLVYSKKNGNSNLISANLTWYKNLGNDLIYPEVEYVINSDQPISNFIASSLGNNGVFNSSSVYTPKVQYSNYDLFGNLLQYRKTKGNNNSKIWGYKNQYPIVDIKNASYNEVYYEGFESIPAIKSWSFETDNTFARTGSTSLRSINSTVDENTYFAPFLNINNTTTKMYRYSCWVYSNGPSAQLFFFMKPNTDDDPYATGYVPHDIPTTETYKWVYLEGEVAVPSNMKRIYLRIDNNGGGTVWFDDLKLCPSDAQMTTYTYKPLYGISSVTDNNGKSTFYDYDDFGRLLMVRDNQLNVLKRYNYNLAGENLDINSYTFEITTSVKSGSGTITPINPTVTPGGSQTITITPSEGYHILDVKVRGVSAGPLTSYIFSGSSTTTDQKIEAEFEINSYEVKFDSQSGSPVAPITVNYNKTIVAPAPPTKPGYTFLGWYKDAAYTNTWNFDADVVKAITTLYAKWNTTITPYLDVSLTSLNFDNSGGVATFNISSNVGWNISIQGTDGITANPSSGSNNAEITITCGPYQSDWGEFNTSRSATIVISDSKGLIIKTINLYQGSTSNEEF